MSKPDDLSKPLVALDHDSTLVCVIEMSGSSWLVAATVPGVDRAAEAAGRPGAAARAGGALAPGGGTGRPNDHAHGGGV